MEVICKECQGSGVNTVIYCGQVASNCCGGCEREVICEICKGNGQVEIDTFEEVEKNHEDLHENLLETITEINKIYGKEFTEEYMNEVFLTI